MSVVYGKHRGVEAGDGRQPHRRHLEHVLDRDAPLERRHRARARRRRRSTVRNITSASADGETTFGATPPLISPTV